MSIAATPPPVMTGLTMDRKSLLSALARAQPIVPARFCKPIYTGVSLEASDGQLCVRATDGDLALYTHVPVDGGLPTCVVPLGELVGRLKASKQPICSLSLSPGGQRLRINGGCVEHAVQTLPANEFPPVADEYSGQALTVSAAEFGRAVRVVAPAVARDTTRYAINGVLLESDDQGTRLVATDGRRLVMAELASATTEFTDRAILPVQLARLAEKFADPHSEELIISIARQRAADGTARPGQVFVAGAGWLLSTDELEARFPQYQDVVPASHSRFTVERTVLLEALAEVALAAGDFSRQVRLHLSPRRLRLDASGAGQSTATLPARFMGGGDRVIHSAFNPNYLLEALKSLSAERIVIDVAQNGCGIDGKIYGKPALLYAEGDESVRWVIMPISVDWPATREYLGSNFKEELAHAG